MVRAQAGTTKPPVRALAFLACLLTLPLTLGFVGCATERSLQSAGYTFEEIRPAQPGPTPSTERGVEDRRTAERVREALAACADYRYELVKVMAAKGVVQLDGFVSTNLQRTSAGAVASKVAGVNSVQNNLTVKN